MGHGSVTYRITRRRQLLPELTWQEWAQMIALTPLFLMVAVMSIATAASWLYIAVRLVGWLL